MNKARAKYIASMRGEMPTPGLLVEYLTWMRTENPEGAAQLEEDIAETLSTEQGLRVLKMLEKAVLLRPIPDGSDDRALREINAVRNFILEIRRLVSNGGR